MLDEGMDGVCFYDVLLLEVDAVSAQEHDHAQRFVVRVSYHFPCCTEERL